MQTLQLITASSAVPLHLRQDAGLNDEPVSSRSLWGDAIWRLDFNKPGRTITQATVRWDHSLPDGTTLIHPKHAELLNAFRRLAWSLLAEPGDGAGPLATTGMYAVSHGIKLLCRWMVANGLNTFHELGPGALQRYLDDVPSLLVDELDEETGDEPELTPGAVWVRLVVVTYIWRQREALAEAGIPTLPTVPWGGESANEIAERLATKAAAQIPPIPAEVAIPVMNTAHRLIGRPADDVISLIDEFQRAWERGGRGGAGKAPGKSRWVRGIAAYRAIRAFEFTTIEGETTPWRQRFAAPAVGNTERLAKEVRACIADVQSACIIVVQSTSGMRSSELCGLPHGLDQASGLPTCVDVQKSASGLYEVFTVRSVMTKTEDTPREVEWVLGMRLAGTDVVPPAVRALQVLNRLMAPWRTDADGSPLLVFFRKSGFLGKNGVHPITTLQLAFRTKKFIARNVDLSNIPDTSARALKSGDLIVYRESQGTCVRPHQWRKTLAHFVFNTDNRLLPAISMQFQHISMAMTERGYLGRNQAMFQAFDGARAQETASFFYEMATGKSPAAGRMAQRIEEHIEPMRQAIDGLPPHRAWDKVLSIVIDNGLRLWFAPHGKCLPLSPADMRCHTAAGSAHWLNKEPNHAVREPALCAGCGCFVLDTRHADFWKDRFVRNWASWKAAERQGLQGSFRVIHERAIQARTLLIRLGFDAGALEQAATEELNDA